MMNIKCTYYKMYKTSILLQRPYWNFVWK